PQPRHFGGPVAAWREAQQPADFFLVGTDGGAGWIGLRAGDERAVGQSDDCVGQADAAGQAGEAARFVLRRIVDEEMGGAAGGAAVDAAVFALGQRENAALVRRDDAVQV